MNNSSGQTLRLPCSQRETRNYWESQLYHILSQQRQRERDRKSREIIETYQRALSNLLKSETDHCVEIIDESTLEERVMLSEMTCIQMRRMKEAENQLEVAEKRIVELESEIESMNKERVKCPCCLLYASEIKEKADNWLAALECGHMFCKYCNKAVYRAAKPEMPKCPLCKSTIAHDDIYKLYI